MKKLLPLLAWAWIAFPFAARADDAPADLVTDGAEWKPLANGAQEKLYALDFDAVEAGERELREADARFPSGYPKLVAYCGALGNASEKSEEAWQAHFAKLDAWLQARPGSIVAAAATGNAWTSYAWFARGSGYANTVTEEGWRKFRERLAKAKEALDAGYAARHGQGIPPEWYTAYLTVGLGQGWPRPEYDKWFDEAVGAYPDYFPLYTDKAYWLLPRWYGREGDWEKFAAEAADRHGAAVYALIGWYQLRFYKKPTYFADTGLDWDRMKAGFEELEARYPRSASNLSAFCLLACLAKDMETARRLFAKLGGRLVAKDWDSPDALAADKKWAGVSAPPPGSP